MRREARTGMVPFSAWCSLVALQHQYLPPLEGSRKELAITAGSSYLGLYALRPGHIQPPALDLALRGNVVTISTTWAERWGPPIRARTGSSKAIRRALQMTAAWPGWSMTSRCGSRGSRSPRLGTKEVFG